MDVNKYKIEEKWLKKHTFNQILKQGQSMYKKITNKELTQKKSVFMELTKLLAMLFDPNVE